ncbi:hypothetical protein GGF37_002394, partial [Kickxella alabastrina]
NVIEILRKVRQMTPIIQQVDISWPNLFYRYTSEQVSTDFRTSNLAFGEIRNRMWVIESIQRNAGSLKTLSLTPMDMETATALLRNAHGGPVVYQCLESFEIITSYRMAVPVMSRFSAAAQTIDTTVYFPALKSCKICGHYLFVDDALFRGNSSTLERLDICITTNFIDIADKFCIFIASRFTNLQSICLALVNSSLVSSVEKDTALKSIQELSVLNRLRVIEIPTVSLEFEDVITVMRHVPYLQKLSYMPARAAPSTDR